jgi:hypothetical protein
MWEGGLLTKPALGLMKYMKNVDIELRKPWTTDSTHCNKNFGKEEDDSIEQMASYMVASKAWVNVTNVGGGERPTFASPAAMLASNSLPVMNGGGRRIEEQKHQKKMAKQINNQSTCHLLPP